MAIHIVQMGETIYTIADKYKVSASRIIQDNDITDPGNLVAGQTLIILFPEQVYTVEAGDTLAGIALKNEVPLQQILRNNPYLMDREYIYPGETIVIRYDNAQGRVTTNGYANTFINKDTLRKTLPYLTYLSVFGYRTVEDAEITEADDEEIIKTAREFGVAPLMLLATLTIQGIGNVENVFSILYSEELTERHIRNILTILKKKGFYGINIILQYLNRENQNTYSRYVTKLTERLNEEGFYVMVTITPNIFISNITGEFEKIDYTAIGRDANEIIIMNFNWGYNYGPPSPVSSNSLMEQFLEYVLNLMPSDKIDIGLPIIGYDWDLPYLVGISKARALTIESALALAGQTGAVIQFDEASQTPFFEYTEDRFGVPVQHIVWFIDARSIEAIMELVKEYGLRGTGIWNIMNYYVQMWLVINSQYEIVKISQE